VAEWTDPMTDEERRQAVVDLLGVLAYGELTAFERLAEDARLAPTVADKAALAGMAVAEFGHFRTLRDRLTAMGIDAGEAMAPFVGALDAFHDSTAPADWLESLVKAYVGDGFAADFYREVAEYVDDETRALVLDVLADTGHARFAVDHVRRAIADDGAIAGRLALWARRLVGEALVQAQRVAVDRDALARLLVGGSVDLAAVGQLLARLTQRHTERMAVMGLTS
jgi:tRNA-(MS[2]IO[6]A)-hydroxylase (MiaE)-like